MPTSKRLCKLVLPDHRQCARPPIFANIWRHFWLMYLGWGLVAPGVLWVGDRLLLTMLQDRPRQKIIQPPVSAVLRLRNAGSDKATASSKKRVNLYMSH